MFIFLFGLLTRSKKETRMLACEKMKNVIPHLQKQSSLQQSLLINYILLLPHTFRHHNQISRLRRLKLPPLARLKCLHHLNNLTDGSNKLIA